LGQFTITLYALSPTRIGALTLHSIGGTIGTALYVQIGRGLLNGGPASLFIAFTLWCSVILAVTLCMAEMVTYLPISSPFIRFAGRYADEAFGFAAGWNFFIFEAILVPFEMTACNVVIHFWSDAVPTGAVIAIVMVSCDSRSVVAEILRLTIVRVQVLYATINLMAVKWYGETEFWAALGKMLLIIGLIIYTFVAMLGKALFPQPNTSTCSREF
jgi:amino acid transporter